ncbi:hypothetical protein BCV69DRAFT_153071 [Microstroma glucosiphilum]|uniref:Hydrophobin n=1 Tax=Pseudomicrostroma glucosiphilum TaxID=1684307 RepID=A0A316UBE5_9BASI|nr:hypothetical protein BCV69DRAFT_153071 [Pseudomicrostroma glucosiphilum]PWN21723.1 hypothetical protein BCV69DRAFT_153071 [Pseudomicrostroma glucosiphilum]
MKLSTFTLLAIIGASTVLATSAPSQLDGLKEDCEEDKPKSPKHHGHKIKHNTFNPDSSLNPDNDADAPVFPPKTGSPIPPVDHLPTDHPVTPTGTQTTPKATTPKATTEAACSSSVVSQLIGIDVLNCAKINILSHKRDVLPLVEGLDPVLEDLKRRNGFAPGGICDSAVASKLVALGILNCADVNILNASDKALDKETCSSEEVSMLASLGILNCANINILSGKRGHQDKRAHQAMKREQGRRALVERMLNVRDCASKTSAHLISADVLNCATANILSDSAAADKNCSTSTTADLISLSAANCPTINVLSEDDDEDEDDE